MIRRASSTQSSPRASPRTSPSARSPYNAGDNSPRSNSSEQDEEVAAGHMARLSLDHSSSLSQPAPPPAHKTSMSEPPTKKTPSQKAMTKEERRALQEQQRAAKQQKKGDQAPPQRQRNPADHKPNKVAVRTEAQKKVPLFLHLKQYEREGSLTKLVGFSEEDAARVHPSVLALGLQYADGVVRGADARAVAMMQAFQDVVRDFKTPAGDSISRALPKKLGPQFDFLTACRTHSITMGNSFAHLKQAISKVGVDVPEAEAKQQILNSMDQFVRTNIVLASEEVAVSGAQLIADGDVILTFARSSVVEKVLLHAHSLGRHFEVVVVGARPNREGIELLRRLASCGLKCSYGQLAAVSYLLSSGVSKVFLGAGALLSNGAVLARAGTAVVAMMARAARRPVLVFAESYKFSERCLLDSVVLNELGDPDELLLPDAQDGEVTSRDPLSDWRDVSTLKVLNLLYDVTNAEFVDVVVTELGNLPPSSVPVIIRERRQNNQ